MNNLFEREHNSLFQTYKRLPIIADYAKACRIWDVDGNEYLDFLGGIAVNVLGHSHPKVIEAIKVQSEKYLHISNYFYQEPQVSLAEKLQKTGFDRVFYCNSGAEANEGAMKLARRWGSLNNKSRIVSFTGGFHGRTLGTLSMMQKPMYKEGMGPFLDNIDIIEYNSLSALESTINENTSAVFLEFLQGEGGLTFASNEFIAKLKELKEKFNFLVIADEVQSGMYRTGKFYSFNHFDIEVDVCTLAKGVGGGLPLGVLLAKESLANVWEKGMHGTTFGGNALACAVGKVIMDELFSHNLIEHINSISSYLQNKLEGLILKYPKIAKEVKGKGLMTGLEFYNDASIVLEKLTNKRVIANVASGKVLRLVPPFVITESDVDLFISKLDEVLSEL